MKAFTVYGSTKTGKTTVVTSLIKDLVDRRYKVGSIKNIHSSKFSLETLGSNTHKHQSSGASPVTAWGLNETGILYPTRESFLNIISHYDSDFLVCEGVLDYNLPKIITAENTLDLEDRWVDGIFAISGKVATHLGDSYRGVPVVNVLENPTKLCDLVIEKVFPLLPDVDPKCCSFCGYSCSMLRDRILRGDSKRSDCMDHQSSIELRIGNKLIPMVPFVQKILLNTCLGVISTLDGYKDKTQITISLNPKGEHNV